MAERKDVANGRTFSIAGLLFTKGDPADVVYSIPRDTDITRARWDSISRRLTRLSRFYDQAILRNGIPGNANLRSCLRAPLVTLLSSLFLSLYYGSRQTVGA